MAQPHASQFSGIFISYRRDDSSGHAGRLLDCLVDHFGKDRIFMDIDIEPGEDFVEVIENAVGSCEILVSIIGRHWLGNPGETTRRLDNPHDFVRLEIATALSRGIRVIPVLVQRASMPKPQDLPEDLARLTRRNAIELSDLRWRSDVDQLIRVMERVLSMREEEERHKAEEERMLQEAETHRREDEVRLQREAAERQHQQEETVRRAEEKRRQRDLEAERESAEVPETILSPRSTVSSQETHSVSPQPQNANPALTYSAANAHARIDREAQPSPRPLTASGRVLALVRDRPVALTMVMVAIMAAGFLIMAMLNRSDNENPPVSNQNDSDNKTAKPVPPERMTYVPGGTFMMGRDRKDGGDEYESPAHQVTIQPFFIDIYEVTNEDYAKFLAATQHSPPRAWNAVHAAAVPRQPVTGVNWYDANDYARWAGKRLPIEEEWEFAARGTDGRLYPWGKEWKDGLANAQRARAGLADVGFYMGKSPFGAFDMVGNVWEWTASLVRAYPGGSLRTSLSKEKYRTIRGGSYQSNMKQATTTYRSEYEARGAPNYNQTGFRCVKDLVP